MLIFSRWMRGGKILRSTCAIHFHSETIKKTKVGNESEKSWTKALPTELCLVFVGVVCAAASWEELLLVVLVRMWAAGPP